MNVTRTLEGVCEPIRRSGLDPLRDEPAVRRLVRDAVTDCDERSMRGGSPVAADRTGLPNLRRFVDGVVVAVQRGRPLADVLRAQGEDVREEGRGP